MNISIARNCPTILAVFVVASFFVSKAHSQPAVWTNTNTGVSAGIWSDAANWSPALVPTSANSAQINNGGEARITGSVVASRIEVGKNGGVGSVTSAVPGNEIIIDSDLDIGEIGGDFASGPMVVSGDGSFTISNAAHLLVGDSGSGDLDLGQTNATAGAQASGVGTLTLNNVALVEVVDDADVGQAGGSATAIANGTLLVTSVADFQIGADFDVGQSGGTGQATATGLASIQSSQITVGSDADIGRATGSALGNSGNGTLTATDATISIGFADALSPGSLNIGDVGATTTLFGSGFGSVSLERTSLDVADKINVGGLSGGGTNASNNSSGSLTLIDSSVAAADVNVAAVAVGTAGTAEGSLSLDGSLLAVDGVLGLGSGATLSFDLDGTTRADGTGGADQFGAIDVISATLGGNLEVMLGGSFSPVAGDQFDLISATGLIAGSFTNTSLPTLSAGLTWNVLQTSNSFSLQVLGAGVDGDFDSDGDVDGSDFLLWQRGGSPNPRSATDLASWNAGYGSGSLSVAARAVPEPSAIIVLSIAAALFPMRLRRREYR